MTYTWPIETYFKESILHKYCKDTFEKQIPPALQYKIYG